WFIMNHNQKKIRKQMKHPFAEGKQSVADLLKAGVSTDKIELPDGSARDFCKLAKKFGVDYAIRKDKSQEPARYVVFFKAKDTEVLDQVVKEYVSKTNAKAEKASVREQLKAEKAKAHENADKQPKRKARKHRKERTEGR
ncbi:MAG: PcfB family protein, partial [Lachnospiraceae bacterium]|nr:PcfB family protein [Lachnospiraceae bacterium]